MSDSAPRQVPFATSFLVVLTALNFLNYIDRKVLSAVLEPARLEFGLGDADAGWLFTAFMVTYSVLAPFVGYVGDRWARKWIVAGSVVIWSAATVGSGLAQNVPTLFAMRALTGVGEAGFVTVAPSIIADLFGPDVRGRKLSIFYLAIPVGSALGYLFGGYMGEHYGWRTAFFVAGGPGIVFGLAAAFLPEPKRGVFDQGSENDEPIPFRASVGKMLRNYAWRVNTVGVTLMTFTIGGLADWMPTYLHRVHGLGLGEAGTFFGGLTVVAGLLGTLVGGSLGDRLYRRRAGGYFTLSGWGLLIGAPFIALMPYVPMGVGLAAVIFVAEFFLFLNTGPLNAALVGCVGPRLRASAFAVNMFVLHMLGDAISPPIIGALSEAFGNLGFAIALTAIPVGIGGLSLLLGARRVDGAPKGLMQDA